MGSKTTIIEQLNNMSTEDKCYFFVSVVYANCRDIGEPLAYFLADLVMTKQPEIEFDQGKQFIEDGNITIFIKGTEHEIHSTLEFIQMALNYYDTLTDRDAVAQGFLQSMRKLLPDEEEPSEPRPSVPQVPNQPKTYSKGWSHKRKKHDPIVWYTTARAGTSKTRQGYYTIGNPNPTITPTGALATTEYRFEINEDIQYCPNRPHCSAKRCQCRRTCNDDGTCKGYSCISG